MNINDTLSRAALPLGQVKACTANYQIFQVQEEQRFQKEVQEIDMEDSLFVTDGPLEKIRQATANDPSPPGSHKRRQGRMAGQQSQTTNVYSGILAIS